MKYILILLTMTAALFPFGIDVNYDFSAVTLMRGADTQEYFSLEELRGDLVTENRDVYTGVLEEETQLIRLYNSASVRMTLSDRLSINTRFRQIYGLYADDLYMPFSINRFYADFRGDKLKLKAGRFFAGDPTIRRSLDGLALDLSYIKALPLRFVYGAEAPSVYSVRTAPDFYGKQYMVLQTGLWKFGAAYTMVIDESTEDVYFHIMAGSWKGNLLGVRISTYGEYRATEGKMGNSFLNLSRAIGSNVLVNADYRLVLQKDWVINADEDIYFTGHAYDVYRLGLYYEFNSKLGLELSQLITDFQEEQYFNTFAEILFPFGGLGVVYAVHPDGSETDFSAKLAHKFGTKLKVEGGVNYISEEISFDETETATAMGTFIGVDYKVLQSLDAGLRVYQMDSPQFDSHIRALFKLNYRLSL